MSLHLIKLSVGSESFRHLGLWQAKRLQDLEAAGKNPELIHVTRHTPKRAEELLEDGSIFWVVKGWIVARQKLLELRPIQSDGKPHCGIVYDKKIVPVQWHKRKAFQSWRYLEAKDAPPDRSAGDSDDLPESLRQELRSIGLL